MKIIEILENNKLIIEFQDETKCKKEIQCTNFRRGTVKNPYDKSVYGIGYLGDGKFLTKENYQVTHNNRTWHDLIRRCYHQTYIESHQAYDGCSVCDDWLNFQNFAEWYEKNYYEIGNERMHLDKDIQVKNNRVYSPETCLIIPQRINMIFMNKLKSRDIDLPNAIYRSKTGFKSSYNGKSLGVYKTLDEAISVHDSHMRKHIKNVANEYRDKIPETTYEALLNY